MLVLRRRLQPRHLFKQFLSPHHDRGRLVHKRSAAAEQSPVKMAQVKIRWALCHTRHTVASIFDFWAHLRRLGVSNCSIVRFRRWARRFHYPWLAYSIPTAFALMAGDVISQVYIDKRKKKRDMNWCRTVHYGLIGFILVGPISSKLFLVWYRRTGRGGRLVRMAKTVFYDIFIVTPIVISTIMAAYDYKFLYDTFKDISANDLNQNSLKSYGNKLVDRYKNPFTEDLLIYLQTKPLVALTACFLLPSALRGYLRRLYYIAFYAFVSNRDFKYKLGPEIQKYRAGKNQEDVGGPACMLRDVVVSKIKGKSKQRTEK